MSQQIPIQSQQSGQLTDAQQPQQSGQIQQPQQSEQVQQSGQAQQSGQIQQSGQRPTGQLFPTQNFLSQSVRTASIAALEQCLADLTAVNMQCKTAHWNVRGPDFYQLHELFEDLVETFDPLIDDVAERATALGGQAPGTALVVAQRASVPQLSPTTSDEGTILQQLATSLATLDATLYEQINRVSEQGDLDTADLLNEVSREVSKSLWFVEAHLQGQPPTAGSGQSGQQFQAQVQQ